MSSFLSELDQEPFDGEEFVERFAWRATNGKCDVLDANALHSAFESGIKDLKAIEDNHRLKCERLEAICREEEKKHYLKVMQMQQKAKESFASFELLDNRLDVVAAKVVYLGDQLEGINTPRSRSVEARFILRKMEEFLEIEEEEENSSVDLYEEADVIQKLHLISQELPKDAKFESARHRIAQKYDQIERQLIEEFVRAHKTDDKNRMKEIASIVSHFKGFSQCVDAFIEQSQMGIFLGINIFTDILPLCSKNQQIVREVFTNSEQVMSKFVLNIFHGKVQEYIQSRLNDPSVTSDHSSDTYLSELYDLYSKTNRLSNQLSASNIEGCDPVFLNKMTRNIFSRFLDSYIAIETSSLREKCDAILNRYYESKNHQKKPIPSGFGQELKRDLQAKIGRANINIGTLANITITTAAADTNYGGETFLSEEIAISLLQETKLALQRCQLLSKNGQELATNALQILDIELQFLCADHIDYAIDCCLQSIPTIETARSHAPEIYFFDCVRQCNAICHLIEKQFVDSVIPLVASVPAKHSECLKRKRELNDQLELKLNSGLEKCLSAIVQWVKSLLQSEQKKVDFKPETEDKDFDFTTQTTPIQTKACTKVVKFVNGQLMAMRDSLDGNNIETVLTELGTRLHRVIFEHLQQFTFTIVGAMVLICDINEYRKCISAFRIPLLDQLFGVLHALCNLLIVAPENLKQVCNGDQLVGLERTILSNFVQLRADYKSAKLNNQFK